MKAAFKKFVKTLGLTAEVEAFLNTNKIGFAIFDIEKGKNGIMKFKTLSDFHRVEAVSITREEQKVWDLFHDFNNVRNGIAVIMHAIETGKAINDETYNNQSKLTPTAPLPKVKSFVAFWATLSDDDKKKAIEIAANWLKDSHIDKTSFEHFFINGTKGLELKEGDYVLGYDEMYSEAVAARVLQASPAGLVTCVDNGGYFTLSASFKPQVVARETLPAVITEKFDETFEKMNKEAEEQKEYRLDKAVTAANKASESAKKVFERLTNMNITTDGLLVTAKKLRAENTFTEEEAAVIDEKITLATKTLAEGKEALIKADAEKTKIYDKLMKLRLTTEDAISKAVGDLNQAKLGKERTDAVRARIKAAKDALKNPATTAPATAEATAPAEGTPAPARRAPRRQNAENAPTENAPQTETNA